MADKDDAPVTPTFEASFFEKVGIKFFKFVNKYIPWHKLPGLFGALNLSMLRIELRQYNLHDGYATTESQGNAQTDPLDDKRYLNARHSDGMFNSLEMPCMGRTGIRFGRSFPRKYTQKPTEEELWTPNPRMISERFMKRRDDKFIPATTLNLLAAAWIQFQTHDWFNHDRDESNYNIPLPEGDTWPGHEMLLFKTKPDDVQHPSDLKCPGYQNTNTTWWDGSQIYGSTEAITQKLRTKNPDGKLTLDKDENGKDVFLPRDHQGQAITGFTDNWWIGMELLHTLFALEHNCLCDMFRENYPDWTGDQIFDKARLVNSALMAKIHTIEWTPAILAHPALQIAMSANWWGLFGETINKLVGRVSKSEVISGIPGSGVDHYGVPFSLTEEFVSVYRLHSLLPDNIAFFNVQDKGKHVFNTPLEDTLLEKSRDAIENSGKKLDLAGAFYSFGINYPGAVTNFNYPNFLRHLKTPDGQTKDLGTVDILRDRERGVPRYCQFRRLLRMTVPKDFDELTGGNKELAQELSEAYGGDIEAVDTLVGSHSEPLPKGFGFSETAFRIFILMASRRLNSDRFIAGQWNEKTYSKEGLKYVQNTGMKDILGRHFPELKPILKKSKNVFAQWDQLSESKEYKGIETNEPK